MRTFVALPVPLSGEPLRFLKACRERLQEAGAAVRWTPESHYHVTLRFFGEIADEQLPGLVEAVQNALTGTGPFEAALEGWGAFPERGVPRVVWAGASSSGDAWPHTPFTDLYYRLVGSARVAGVKVKREEFHPHVTLGRMRPDGPRDALRQVLRLDPPPGASFTATHVTLFQSELTPRGSIYTPLMEAPLG